MRRRDFMILVAGVAIARRARGQGDAFQVVVHPDCSATSISTDFLRRAWLKKATSWDDGTTVRPIDLPAGDATRDRFTRDIIKKTPSQLKSYWNQQIFSGKGVPPPEAHSAEEAIAYVVAHEGAVAYLPAGADIGGAKRIEVRP